MSYELKDNRGRLQRIKAASLAQARFALEVINAENDRQPDGGRALAHSWEDADPQRDRCRKVA
jgi:hypothetical protein